MKVVKKAVKVLRGAGCVVAPGRKNNLTPRGGAAFVNVPIPYAMVDGASYREMTDSAAEATCRAAALLAEAGLVTYTPLARFRGPGGCDYAFIPVGGFWVVGDFFHGGGRPHDAP